jgi:hypothetical protein
MGELTLLLTNGDSRDFSSLKIAQDVVESKCVLVCANEYSMSGFVLEVLVKRSKLLKLDIDCSDEGELLDILWDEYLELSAQDTLVLNVFSQVSNHLEVDQVAPLLRDGGYDVLYLLPGEFMHGSIAQQKQVLRLVDWVYRETTVEVCCFCEERSLIYNEASEIASTVKEVKYLDDEVFVLSRKTNGNWRKQIDIETIMV